jgi:hypothetical protein
VLPEPSVTVQVTVVDPTSNVAGASLVVLATLQLSAVVGVPNAMPEAAAEHAPASAETVTAAGAVMVGFSSSVTVTDCVAVAVLPEPSVTVQVTVVTPNGNVAGASLVVLATLQLSAVVGVPSEKPEAAAVHAPASAETVTASGAVMVGTVLSRTVTVKLAVVEFPAASCAVYVTVVVPKLNVEPDVTSGPNDVTLQLSEAVGAGQDTTALHAPSSLLTLMSAGMPLMAGA